VCSSTGWIGAGPDLDERPARPGFVAIFFVGDHLGLLYLLNITVSTITVFFGPAEAAMIPMLVPKRQLISANGIFTLTLNAAFALGFTLLGR
jgi:hypothetical protein